jgi:hypothetical protein
MRASPAPASEASLAVTGPGVSMKEPFGHGSIRYAGRRWLLDAYGSLTWRLRAHLALRAIRPGITVGPLRASAGTAA